jgi:putative PEP-CTERM system TPR-repeat lipoprotein
MRLLQFLFIALTFLMPFHYVNADSIPALLLKSKAAIDNNEFNAALIHLKNASLQEPESKQVRLELVKLYLLTGQGLLAETELNRAEKKMSIPVEETLVLRARALLQQGKFEIIDQIASQALDLPQSKIAQLRAIQGHAYFEQRRFDDALQMFKRAELLDPLQMTVQAGISKIYQIQGNTEQESRLLNDLLVSYPNNPEVLLLAGDLNRRMGLYKRAVELFEQAGEIQKTNVNVWFGLVRVYIQNKEFTKAKVEIEKVLKSHPEHQVGNYLLAVIAFEQGEYNRAKSAIDIVLKGEKRNYEAFHLLSVIQFQQQKYSDAEKSIKKYLEKNPEDAKALKTLGAIYLKQKQGGLAIKTLLPLQKLNNAYIDSMIASAYLLTGNEEKSNEYIDRALKRAPDNETIKRHIQRTKLLTGAVLDIEFTDNDFNDFITVGHINILNFIRKKDYQTALDLCNGYLAKEPENPVIHYLIGFIYMSQGLLEDAKKAFQISLSKSPEFIQAKLSLARVFLMEKNSRKAEQEYREVLKIDDSNDPAMVALAGIYARKSDKEEMLKWLNLSRNTNSASLASREVLEDYYRKNARYELAMAISGEMVEIQPDNIKLLEKHAANQKRTGRLDLAIKTFETIVSLSPDSINSWKGLGKLQYLDNDFKNARFSFLKALEKESDDILSNVILIQMDLREKKLTKAFSRAQKLISIHPENSAGYEMKGDVYIFQNKPALAVKEYRKAINISYSTDTFLKLYTALNRDNKNKLALDFLLDGVSKHPQDIKLKEVLAHAYRVRGDNRKSISLYEEIIQSGDVNDRIYNQMALVALDLGSPMSMEYADMAYNLNPSNPLNMDTLGWVFFKNKNLDKSLELLRAAVKAAPGNPDIRYHYAVALEKADRVSEAKKQLYLATSLDGDFINLDQARKLLNKLTQ